MTGICIYFQVHQPYRLKRYTVFQLGSDHEYEDEQLNTQILNKVADKCYLPANEIIHRLIKEFPGVFKVAFSISGITLEQLQRQRPEVIESFQRLASSGQVEFLNESYYHTLAFLHSPAEFSKQVELQQSKIRELFGQEAVTFRNTELIFSNSLATLIGEMGYRVILAEGAEKILGWRSPNYLYGVPGSPKIKCLLRNYRLSDDIAFRFSNRSWPEYPLTADKFAAWLNSTKQEQLINLFMDYETFGEHQWEETGIFEFLRALPGAILKYPELFFLTPQEAAAQFSPLADLDVPQYVSWADTERDLTAWQGNSMQKDAAKSLYRLEEAALRADGELLNKWRRLQTSDHFYYMCTKWFADGTVHKYFNHYASPYDAYINYMNILDDLSGLLYEKA